MILGGLLLAVAVTPAVAVTSDQAIPVPESTEWLRARTERYELISDAGERRTREVAANLQAFAGALQRQHPSLRRGGATTKVIVFGQRKESQPFFDLAVHQKDSKTAGVFVSRDEAGGGGTMIVDSGADWKATRTPMHELVHDLLSGGARPPLWLEEGMAEYFSGRGVPIRPHLQLLARLGPIPIEELMLVERGTPQAIDPRFYATSWAAAAWLVPNAAFDSLLDDVRHGMPFADALRSRYGSSLRDLQRGIDNPPRKALPMLVDPIGNARIDVEAMSRADALYEMASFLETIPAPGDAKHFHEAVVAADPKHVRSLTALGRYDEAIANAPQDTELSLTYAESLLHDALGARAGTIENLDVGAFRKARRLAEQALANQGDAARALADIGTSWIVESDALAGVEPLQRAHDLAPARPDVSLNLMALLYRTDDAGHGDELLRQLEASDDLQVVTAARRIFVRERLAAANALVADEKLEEAAALVRQIAARTTGANARQNLEARADRLMATALYNRAVEQVNSGNRAGALSTLDELLATTKDESAIDDARKLKEQLAGRK